MASIRFRLKPIPPFRLDFTVWALRRRPHNIIDRFDGRVYRRVLVLDGKPVEIAVEQVAPRDTPEVEVRATAYSHTVRPAIEAMLRRVLGLDIDLGPFYQLARKDLLLGPMAERFYGMKPVRFPSNFEAFANGVSCQQISLTAGLYLINKIAETYGQGCLVDRKRAYPFAEARRISRLSVDDLRALGYSRNKARYLIELAEMASGADNPDFAAIEALDDEAAMAALCRLSGVGRWTAEYVMLRGFGRLNIFPADDVGGRNRLREWLRIRRELDYTGVRKVVERWHPWAGFIYYHLLLSGLAERGIVSLTRSPEADLRGRGTIR